MDNVVRILIVEDLPSDADLAKREIKAALPSCVFEVVETQEDYLAAIERFQPDLIVSDYRMPHFDGLTALKLAQQHASLVPFIILTGSMNEETAVECMKTGATDYIIKEHVKRLGLAVVSALEQKRLRLEKEEAEAKEREAQTALRESEVRLAESNDLLSCVLEHTHMMAVFLDSRFNFIWVNRPYADTCRHEPSFFPGKNHFDLYPNTEIQAIFQWVVDTGEPFFVLAKPFEFPDQPERGVTYWDWSLIPIKDDIGKVTGLVFTLVEVTERKQAEEALRRSKEFGETVLNSIEDNISIIDVRDYRIMGVNQSFLTRLGLKEEEAIGKFCYEVTHHRNSPCIPQNDPCPLWETLKTGKQSTFEHIHYNKDGEKVYVEVSATPIKNEKGEIIQVVHVGRDITAKKLAEEEKASLQEQLRQSQKMEAIGQLAGGIAHDFNNLLTVIRGYSQLSLNEIQKHDPLCENIEEIEKAANRASELTRQLLAFSRRQLLEVKVIDMNVLIQGMEKMLRRMIRENIELIIEPGENLGKIKADPGQIEQVILNLAVNAKDAMPSEGRLILKIENSELDEGFVKSHLGSKPGQYVRLRVTDTGIGMPPEVREKVFEPFFTTKEKGKGTGLGLSTVYGIVKQSEGYIWVWSEPGRGTSIEIYLPRVEGPLEEMREKIIGEVFQGHETILIVEDEEVVRKLAVRVLKKQGYKVLEASDGGKAFMLCEEIKEPIHLILTDVVMPGMSGSKLVERLKVIHPEMKALYMSGYADNAVLHHGILEQGINFIQKPFNVDGLARKVREVLDKRSDSSD